MPEFTIKVGVVGGEVTAAQLRSIESIMKSIGTAAASTGTPISGIAVQLNSVRGAVDQLNKKNADYWMANSRYIEKGNKENADYWNARRKLDNDFNRDHLRALEENSRRDSAAIDKTNNANANYWNAKRKAEEDFSRSHIRALDENAKRDVDTTTKSNNSNASYWLAKQKFENDFNRDHARALEENARRDKQAAADSVSVWEKGLASIGKGFITGLGISLAFEALEGIKGAITGAVSAALDYEKAFARVKASSTDSAEGLAHLSAGLRELAKEIPVPVTELAAIATNVEKLGVSGGNIAKFTEVMARFASVSATSATDATEAIGRFMNNMGTAPAMIEKVASTILKVGISSAASEMEVAKMAQRLSGIGRTFNMSEADIIALSGALSDLGIRADMGSSAFQKMFLDMAKAVEQHGTKVVEFARVAHMSVKDFSEAMRTDAMGAMVAFLKGLRDTDGGALELVKTLDDLGIKEIRRVQVLLRTTNALDRFLEFQKLAREEMKTGLELQDRSNITFDTAAGKIDLMKAAWNDLGIVLGGVLTKLFLIETHNQFKFPKGASVPSSGEKIFTPGAGDISTLLGPGGFVNGVFEDSGPSGVIGTGVKVAAVVKETGKALYDASAQADAFMKKLYESPAGGMAKEMELLVARGAPAAVIFKEFGFALSASGDSITDAAGRTAKLSGNVAELMRLHQQGVGEGIFLNKDVFDIFKSANPEEIARQNRVIEFLKNLPGPGVVRTTNKYGIGGLELLPWETAPIGKGLSQSREQVDLEQQQRAFKEQEDQVKAHQDMLDRIKESFFRKDIDDQAEALGQLAHEGADAMQAFRKFHDLLDNYPEALNATTRAFLQLGAVQTIWKGGWIGVTNSFGDAVADMLTGAKSLKDGLGSILDSVKNTFKSTFKRIVSDAISNLFSPLVSFAKGFFENLFSSFHLGGGMLASSLGGGSNPYGASSNAGIVGNGLSAAASATGAQYGFGGFGAGSGGGTSAGSGGGLFAGLKGLWGRLSGGASGWAGAGSALTNIAGPAGILAALSGNKGALWGGLAGAGFGALGTLAAWGTGAGLGGILGGAAAFGPIGAAVGLGASLLIKAFSKDAYTSGSKEIARDFGGVSVGPNTIEAFLGQIGISKKQFEGIRKDVTSSPKFLTDVLFPLAKQQGKVEAFLKSLEGVGTSWGTFNFRGAFEEWQKTGDSSKLNAAFVGAFSVSERLKAALPNFATVLAASGSKSGSLIRVPLKHRPAHGANPPPPPPPPPVDDGSDNDPNKYPDGERPFTIESVPITVIVQTHGYVDREVIRNIARTEIVPQVIDALQRNDLLPDGRNAGDSMREVTSIKPLNRRRGAGSGLSRVSLP